MPGVYAKRIVRRYLEEVVNTGDVDRLEEFISPEYVELEDPSGRVLGVEGAREHVLGVRRVWGDLKVSVEHQIAEGEWVATRITARGTHAGSWMGIAPTGKALEMTGVNLDRVVDGRIVAHGGAANLLHPLLEAGAVRAVGPEAAGEE